MKSDVKFVKTFYFRNIKKRQKYLFLQSHHWRKLKSFISYVSLKL